MHIARRVLSLLQHLRLERGLGEHRLLGIRIFRALRIFITRPDRLLNPIVYGLAFLHLLREPRLDSLLLRT